LIADDAFANIRPGAAVRRGESRNDGDGRFGGSEERVDGAPEVLQILHLHGVASARYDVDIFYSCHIIEFL
jgi:hypothetical protein